MGKATVTKAQIHKIDRLTFQVEALQTAVGDRRVAELLGVAKNELIRALREAEKSA